VSGLYGKVSEQALESAASSGGPTVQVFTRLDQAPAVGRALHMAFEEGVLVLADNFSKAKSLRHWLSN
jgi:hypothetical protein